MTDKIAIDFRASGVTLKDEIRRWVKHHKWFEITAQTNQAKLDQQFGSMIETLAGQLDYHDQTKLRRNLLDCWDHLMAKCMKIDAICRTGCRSKTELLELEFLRCKAIATAQELAEVLELVINPNEAIYGADASRGLNPYKCDAISCLEKNDRSVSIKSVADSEQWCTFAWAAERLGVSKGTISNWARKGRLRDNGGWGQQRRVLKADVLLIWQRQEDEALLNDVREIREDAARIENRH